MLVTMVLTRAAVRPRLLREQLGSDFHPETIPSRNPYLFPPCSRVANSTRANWEHARECTRWAAEAKTKEDQHILLEMAKAWTNIALVESDIARQVSFEGRPAASLNNRASSGAAPMRRAAKLVRGSQILFFTVLFGVSLHCFLGMPTSVNDMRPRGVRMVCRLLVMSTLMMLGRLSMVAGGVCEMLRGLLVMFCSLLGHLRSSINESKLTNTLQTVL
jgi:hypothetical protein